jgi:phage gpG-like protein
LEPKDFNNKLNGLQKVLKSLPRKVGAQAVVFFKSRFREQAWADNATEPWKKRKPGAKRNTGRAILIASGRLRRSIRVIASTPSSVTIGTDVPYARAHNEGFRGTVQVPEHTRNRYRKVKYGTGIFSIKTRRERQRTVKEVVEGGEIKVKAHPKRMNLPRRQFMGNSAVLNNQIKRIIMAEINKALK